MEKSKVYYTDMRALPGTNLLIKLKELIKAAGIAEIDMEKKFTAVKIHFGEPGNLAFLRPNYAKVVVDTIKELGGKPFLTDCSTLYVGRRKNALDHLDAAAENGFSPFSTGCQIIIADGLKGTDEVLVPVPDGKMVTEAKIGRAVMDADVFISLSHFKGHEEAGFGGALKNIGMGCGSRAGKMEQHCTGKPAVSNSRCRSCKICTNYCAHDAISFDSTTGKASIDHDKCVGCGRCIAVCNFDAIYNPNYSANDDLNVKIAEYSAAVLRGRPHFHISLVMDVSPYCDCHSENDLAIIPDVGMFASFDPVALDMACADACNAMPIISGSMLSEKEHVHHDHFKNTHPETNWMVCVDRAEEMGLGTKEYELIKLK